MRTLGSLFGLVDRETMYELCRYSAEDRQWTTQPSSSSTVTMHQSPAIPRPLPAAAVVSVPVKTPFSHSRRSYGRR